MLNITFLGLGLMGCPMSAHLARSGHALTVWNRSAGKADPLLALGAHADDDLQRAVASADLIISMLADGPAVLEVAALARASLRPNIRGST